MALVVKNPPANGGDPLEEGMATNSSILAWRIQWTEEPGGLQSKELAIMGYHYTLIRMTDIQKTDNAKC